MYRFEKQSLMDLNMNALSRSKNPMGYFLKRLEMQVFKTAVLKICTNHVCKPWCTVYAAHMLGNACSVGFLH